MTTSPSPAVQAADDNVRDIREVFVDTETTGTHDDARPWEIALIAREHRPGHRTLDYVILLQILDVDLTTADPEALSIGRFHERHIVHGTTPPEHIVLPTTSHIPDWRQFPTGLTVGVEEAFAAVLVTAWTTGAHLIGVNPAFDQRILTGMLARHGITPAWHYHPRCVADRAAGYLAGLIAGRDAALAGHPIPAVTDVRAVLALPPSSRKVTSLAGVDAPPPETRHTAYGDADWGRRVWDHIHQPLTALIAYPARALEGVAVRLAHDFLAFGGVAELLAAITYDGERSHIEILGTGLNPAAMFGYYHSAQLEALAISHRNQRNNSPGPHPPIVGYALVVETLVLPAGPGALAPVAFGEQALVVTADTAGNTYSVRVSRTPGDTVEPWPPSADYVDPLHDRIRTLVRTLATTQEPR